MLARALHTATLLPNGQVLVAGGSNNKVPYLSASASLYDPATGLSSLTGFMSFVRIAHTATLLSNGQVLVAGGENGINLSGNATAELYDPAAGLFSSTGSMSTARAYHTATLLPNGQVLVAGGESGSASLASSELYDPATGLFSSTGSMSTPREHQTATLLLNGAVLVAGGSGNALASAELYGVTAPPILPQTITFGPLGSQPFGTAPFTVSATASSGLPVSFNSQTLSVCTVSGSQVAVILPGTCTIQATQGGNNGYAPATPVSQSFQVTFTALAPTSGSTCNGAYNGTFNGNLALSAGQNCIFVGGGATGNVTQKGGNLVLMQSQVGGDVQLKGGGTFTIGPGSTINGNLQIGSIPGGSATNTVCGSTVHGDLQFKNNGTAVLIGAPPSCAGNMIGGNVTIANNTAAASAVGNTMGNNLTVQNNAATTTVDGNTVTGNLTDQGNTAPTQVFTNMVGHNLQCNGNSSITGGGNTAASKQGQCAGF